MCIASQYKETSVAAFYTPALTGGRQVRCLNVALALRNCLCERCGLNANFRGGVLFSGGLCEVCMVVGSRKCSGDVYRKRDAVFARI